MRTSDCGFAMSSQLLGRICGCTAHTGRRAHQGLTDSGPALSHRRQLLHQATHAGSGFNAAPPVAVHAVVLVREDRKRPVRREHRVRDITRGGTRAYTVNPAGRTSTAHAAAPAWSAPADRSTRCALRSRV